MGRVKEGLVELPAVGFEAEAGCDKVAAAEAGDGGGEGEQGVALGGGIGGASVELLEAAAKGDGEGGGEPLGDGGVANFLVEIAEEGAGLVLEEPVGNAAVAPGGEVGGIDGAGVKAGGEDGPDLGEAVKPGKDGGGGLAIVEAGVELLADGGREAGDFANAGGR